MSKQITIPITPEITAWIEGSKKDMEESPPGWRYFDPGFQQVIDAYDLEMAKTAIHQRREVITTSGKAVLKNRLEMLISYRENQDMPKIQEEARRILEEAGMVITETAQGNK